MKKNIAILAAGLAFTGFAASPAMAADHYISGNAGISWMNDIDDAPNTADNLVMDGGYIVLGALGCDYGDYRLELEGGYQQSDVDFYNTNASGGEVQIYSLLANGYYDIDAGGFEPYVTAGVGVAQIKLHDIGATSSNENALAYQIGAGVAVPVGGSVMIDARYRYFSTMEFLNDSQAGTHSVLLGLRVGL
ncbi:outer membrane beta-barrel protein [Chlorobium sp. N1]|uniref:outer membrane protein n=1 Tax=Chlorobium sp. N1 TaxID=2491138 RepID=UPI001F61469D|nr:outer membrane beta-barrel protein [Chlorobium sp. N1]